LTIFPKRKPRWKKDVLSDLLKDGEYNVLVSTHNYREVYNLLTDTYRLLIQCEKAINHNANSDIIFPGFFFIRTRAAYIASLRLILAGQPVEAHATLRLMIEDCWYGLYILNDPSPPKRRKTWLNRNDSEKSKKECRNLFTVKNVREDHEKCDPETAKELNKQYEHTIDFGAHPNLF